MQIQLALEYRGGVIIYRFIHLLSLMTIIAVWLASSSIDDQIGGYTKNELVTYYVVALALEGFVYWYVTDTVKEEIRSGEMSAKSIIKPISDYWRHFFGELGYHMIAPIFTIVPVFLLIFFLHANIVVPFSALAVFSTLIASFFAAVLYFNITYSMGLLTFWFEESTQIASFVWVMLFFFGGQLVPISFFPNGMREVISLLPFRYTFSFPLEVYLGKVQGFDLIYQFTIQITWVVILWIFTKLLWSFGSKRYSSFGN